MEFSKAKMKCWCHPLEKVLRDRIEICKDFQKGTLSASQKFDCIGSLDWLFIKEQ